MSDPMEELKRVVVELEREQLPGVRYAGFRPSDWLVFLGLLETLRSSLPRGADRGGRQR
jgi:hypothetical protein